MAEQPNEIDLDSVIDRLLEGRFYHNISQEVVHERRGVNADSRHVVRGNRPGKAVQLAEYEIRHLCTKAREIFIGQPILLELEAPIKICGMSLIHFTALLRS